MDKIIINGNEIELRLVEQLEGYYLCKLSDWSKEVGMALASQDNLVLGKVHWCIVKEFRIYYKEFQCYPSITALNDRVFYNCQITHEEFLEFFPKDHHQAARISGIGLPTGYGYKL